MELLLNLAWLLLALPAWWLWRNARSTRVDHRLSSLQCLMALGSVLVVLFPVISATDDLMALRTEMEESPLSKRSIRQGVVDRSSVRNLRLQAAPALVGAHPSFALAAERSDIPLVPSFSVPAALSMVSSRAPPTVSLA